MSTEPVADLLLSTSAILLDFDGPVCAVFSGISDFDVATRLRDVLTARMIALPRAIEHERDPLQVLRFAANYDEATLEATEDAFRGGEIAAIGLAQPTPHALDFMRAARAAEKKLAIVSNNSAEAIRAFLELHNATAEVVAIEGRPYGRPDLMKPHPHLLERALSGLGAKAEDAVLIGDSVSDMEAARIVGMASIGFANRENKEAALTEAGASAIVSGANGMAALLNVLR
jgi:HAD superfamily hydrolase (TIGR01549 family)